MEGRAAVLRLRIALYRSYLEDGSFPQRTELYLRQIIETEDELEQLEHIRGTLH